MVCAEPQLVPFPSVDGEFLHYSSDPNPNLRAPQLALKVSFEASAVPRAPLGAHAGV